MLVFAVYYLHVADTADSEFSSLTRIWLEGDEDAEPAAAEAGEEPKAAANASQTAEEVNAAEAASTATYTFVMFVVNLLKQTLHIMPGANPSIYSRNTFKR